MTYSFTEKKRIRRQFGTLPDVMELPYLVKTQTDSYRDFLQASSDPDKRDNKGLEEVFRSIFPINSASQNAALDYVSYELEDCLLNLDEKKSIKILRQIKYNDPNSLALVIWVLDKLISTSLMAKKSASPKGYLESTKMWNSKIGSYLSFIKKMESNLLNLSKDIFEIEKTFKGIKRLDTWKEVERLIIRICTS